ncbi:MAG: ACT domain-containing protein [Nitrospirae bacterium]|nr:MAG: ACT domain-containing protein [Nitrospirota bacterium]
MRNRRPALDNRYAMLTAFGQDRPGIVAALAEGLYHLGCNIEDTCMTRLRDEFAMMLLVRLPVDLAPSQLTDRLTPKTGPLGLTLLCREVPPQTATDTSTTQAPNLLLSVYGADRPGIVAAVARAVADQGGNITDLNTRVIGSTDRPVYVMVLEIHMPGGEQPDALQAALERLKPTLGVDVTLRPIESVQL